MGDLIAAAREIAAADPAIVDESGHECWRCREMIATAAAALLSLPDRPIIVPAAVLEEAAEMLSDLQHWVVDDRGVGGCKEARSLAARLRELARGGRAS